MSKKFLRNFLWEARLVGQNFCFIKIFDRPISRDVTPEIDNLFIPNKIMKPSAPIILFGTFVGGEIKYG